MCGVLRRAATAPSVRRRAWEVALKGAALQGVSPSALDSSSCRLLGRDAGPCTLRSRCARARLPQWRCRPPPLWSLPRRRSPPSVFLFRHVKDVPPLARQCGTLSGCAYASALVCGGVSCVCPVRCRRAGLFSVRRWSYHSSRAPHWRAREPILCDGFSTESQPPRHRPEREPLRSYAACQIPYENETWRLR